MHPRGWVGCGTGFACGKRDTAGGLLSLPPAAPAFSLIFCPHPPDPLPGGKGETKVISCKGLRPLHPRGWVGCGTGFACGKRDTAGACFLGCLPTLPLAYFAAPLPLRGRGRLRLSHARGFAPCIPGAEPGRHRLSLPSRYPVQGEPEVRRKNDRTAFLLAVPAAKERGDRGRWNYPSHATAAFEMVLSPGAGRTSAAGGLTFLVACLPCL